jgi:hypothetical protein
LAINLLPFFQKKPTWVIRLQPAAANTEINHWIFSGRLTRHRMTNLVDKLANTADTTQKYFALFSISFDGQFETP